MKAAVNKQQIMVNKQQQKARAQEIRLKQVNH